MHVGIYKNTITILDMIQIAIERSIPYLRDIQIDGVQFIRLDNSEFTPEHITNVDALVVRSITKCTRSLLEGSRVRLICTATAGMDHIDLGYCRTAGIEVRNASGCNAIAVAQWVFSALSSWACDKREYLQGKTIGIVGVGHVGREVRKRCDAFGLHPLLCDPPRAEREGREGFVSLEQIAQEADIITLHTPLEREGAYPTYHLAGADFVEQCARRPVLINACRGAVCDTEALIKGYRAGRLRDLLIDCWEGEPNPNQELLSLAHISTPHIAGFSADGKLRGSHMCIEAICQFFHLPIPEGLYQYSLLEAPTSELRLPTEREEEALLWAMLQTLNLESLSRRLQVSPNEFEAMRQAYHYPREMSAYSFSSTGSESLDKRLSSLGFNLIKL